MNNEGSINLILAHVWMVGAILENNAAASTAMVILALFLLVVSYFQRRAKHD